MNLDEALAVYEYLKHWPPGQRTEPEEYAFRGAWDVICHFAQETIERERKALEGK